MSSVWPWLAVAALGALHGLNPASGWLLAAARGVRARDASRAIRALAPIAVGHVASVVAVASAVALRASMDRAALLWGGGMLLVVVAIVRIARRGAPRARAATGDAGVALCSFWMTTAHGAGLMLVPALVPICIGDGAVRELTASGSLGIAAAAVALHAVAMLAVTGLLAVAACRATEARRRAPRPATSG